MATLSINDMTTKEVMEVWDTLDVQLKTAPPVIHASQEYPLKEKTKEKVKMFQADKMVNGFMFQSEPFAEEKDPFYMEAYLLGKGSFYLSGGSAGTATIDQLKELRKHLKFIINQMKSSYPDVEEEKDDGKEPKAIIKVDAPWVPTNEQVETVETMITKLMTKELEEDQELDPTAVKAASTAAIKAISQMNWESFKSTSDPVEAETLQKQLEPFDDVGSFDDAMPFEGDLVTYEFPTFNKSPEKMEKSIADLFLGSDSGDHTTNENKSTDTLADTPPSSKENSNKQLTEVFFKTPSDYGNASS